MKKFQLGTDCCRFRAYEEAYMHLFRKSLTQEQRDSTSATLSPVRTPKDEPPPPPELDLDSSPSVSQPSSLSQHKNEVSSNDDGENPAPRLNERTESLQRMQPAKKPSTSSATSASRLAQPRANQAKTATPKADSVAATSSTAAGRTADLSVSGVGKKRPQIADPAKRITPKAGNSSSAQITTASIRKRSSAAPSSSSISATPLATAASAGTHNATSTVPKGPRKRPPPAKSAGTAAARSGLSGAPALAKSSSTTAKERAAASASRALKAEEKHRMRADKAKEAEMRRREDKGMLLPEREGTPAFASVKRRGAPNSSVRKATSVGRRASVNLRRTRSATRDVDDDLVDLEGDEAMAMADAIMGALDGNGEDDPTDRNSMSRPSIGGGGDGAGSHSRSSGTGWWSVGSPGREPNTPLRQGKVRSASELSPQYADRHLLLEKWQAKHASPSGEAGAAGTKGTSKAVQGTAASRVGGSPLKKGMDTNSSGANSRTNSFTGTRTNRSNSGSATTTYQVPVSERNDDDDDDEVVSVGMRRDDVRLPSFRFMKSSVTPPSKLLMQRAALSGGPNRSPLSPGEDDDDDDDDDTSSGKLRGNLAALLSPVPPTASPSDTQGTLRGGPSTYGRASSASEPRSGGGPPPLVLGATALGTVGEDSPRHHGSPLDGKRKNPLAAGSVGASSAVDGGGGDGWENVRSDSQGRVVNGGGGGNASRGRARSLIDDAMEALSPTLSKSSRKSLSSSSAWSPTSNSSTFSAVQTMSSGDGLSLDPLSPATASSSSSSGDGDGRSSPAMTYILSASSSLSGSFESFDGPDGFREQDAAVLHGWIQVKSKAGTVFSSGWKRRYVVLVRGGRRGFGPRGKGALLLLKQEPSEAALFALCQSGKEGTEALAEYSGRELGLNGDTADVALHYSKAPNKTFGFLVTDSSGTELPLAGSSREERAKWLTALRSILNSHKPATGPQAQAELSAAVSMLALSPKAPPPNLFNNDNTPNSDGSANSAACKMFNGQAGSALTNGDTAAAAALALSPPHPPPLIGQATSQQPSPSEAPGCDNPMGGAADSSSGSSTTSASASQNDSLAERCGPPNLAALETSFDRKNSPTVPSPHQSPSLSGYAPSYRPRSAPIARPPGVAAAGAAGGANGTGGKLSPISHGDDLAVVLASNRHIESATHAAGYLEWRERLRRAAPARIDAVNWSNLVAIATPDDLRDMGKGAGVSSVIIANTGGAVFYAFFKRTAKNSRRASAGRGIMVHASNGSFKQSDSNLQLRSSFSSPVKRTSEKAGSRVSPEKSKPTSSKKGSKSNGENEATVAAPTTAVQGAVRARTRAVNQPGQYHGGGAARANRGSRSLLSVLADGGQYDPLTHPSVDSVVADEEVEDYDDDDDDDDDENDEKDVNEETVDNDDDEDAESASSAEVKDPEWEHDDDEGEDDDEEDEDGDDALDLEVEEVLILKFCRNMMDTQAEFCANQLAMALHVQVPACRLMRKKDNEWDSVASAAYAARKAAAQSLDQQQVALTCDLLEDALHTTNCGLVFEFVHTGQSAKLDLLRPALQDENLWPYDRHRAEALALRAAGALEGGDGDENSETKPSLMSPPGHERATGGGSSHGAGGEASAVDLTSPDLPARLGLGKGASFASPNVASAITGGVFRRHASVHGRTSLFSSMASAPEHDTANHSDLAPHSDRAAAPGESSTVSNSNAAAAAVNAVPSNENPTTPHHVDSSSSSTSAATTAVAVTGVEEEEEEFLEKDLGEILGETLVFDVAIRNPDRFPCKLLGWRGNLDNVLWVERSKFSGSRTLWAIDSSIPRRPLRLHARDDRAAIPALLRTALQGQSSNEQGREGALAGDRAATVRASAKLLYELVGGDSASDGAEQDLEYMDRHVPAFRRGIRRCLKRCRVLREGTLNPLQSELQGAFDQISVELEALKAAQAAAKKATSSSANASPSIAGVATPAKANGVAPIVVTPASSSSGAGGLNANLSPKSPMSPPSARAKQNTANRIGKAVPRTDSGRTDSGPEQAPASSASPSSATAAAGAGSKGWAAASAAAGTAAGPASPTSPKMADVVVDTMAASGLKPKASFRGRFNTQDIRLMALKPSEVAQLEQEYANPQDPPPGEDITAEAVSSSSSSSSTDSGPERIVPDMAKFGSKWKQSAENSGKDAASATASASSNNTAAGATSAGAGSGLQGATSDQISNASAPASSTATGAPPTGRDATVAVINRWTRKLWEVGKRLERRFEDYLLLQEAYEEQLLEATDTFHDAQQTLLALTGVDDAVAAAAAAAASGSHAENSSSSEGSLGDADSSNVNVDAATSEAAASLAEAAAATTTLMRNEPAPTLVTGFIDTGTTNCFTGAYELKIRLEHIGERLRLLLDTVGVLGDGTDDEDELAAAEGCGTPVSDAA